MMLLLLALVPVLFVLAWIDRQDLHPEPRDVLWIAFALGALSAAPVVAVELGADALFTELLADSAWGAIPRAAFTTLLGVALPEELAKFAVLMLYVRRHRAFDEPMDGLVYGAAVALGFAAVENLVYVVQGGAHVAVVRARLAVPGHAFDGMTMGALLAVGLVRPHARGRYALLALLVPVACHTLYDAPMLLALTPFASGVAPSWATVAASVALAPLPIVVTALQWRALRDLAARLRASQLAARTGPHAERPLIPGLGAPIEALLRWGAHGGLRAVFMIGSASSAVSLVLFTVLGAVLFVWFAPLGAFAARLVTDAADAPTLARLGGDGIMRAVVMLVGDGWAESVTLVAGFALVARRLR